MWEGLRSLPLDLADLVARHLVAAERALSREDIEKAYEHAKVARRFAARIGVVREVSGVTAYRAGQFSEALSDLRAARRMTGSEAYLPIMADCERGLGRPERALDLVRSHEADKLDREGRIELTIVESGARRDLGQFDAAVITLQRLPELRDPRPQAWSARLAFAYADALAQAGHQAAAIEWFERAVEFDEDGETDAAERYAELTGTAVAYIEDIEEGAEGDEAKDEVELDDLAELNAQIAEADELEEHLPEAESSEELVSDEVAAAEPSEELASDEVAGAESAEEPVSDEVTEEPSEEKAAAASSPESGEVAKPAAAAATEEPAEKATSGVSPAFIEPDFGDALETPASEAKRED
ncbi:hypothetical protein [Sinosporangium siamense]|nr:hypothetical protein [Sinosporangium siamense]